MATECKKEGSLKAILFIIIIALFGLTIILRGFCGKVLVSHFGMDNAFIRLVYWGDERFVDTLIDSRGEQTINEDAATVYVDWTSMYPFEGDDKIVEVQEINLDEKLNNSLPTRFVSKAKNALVYYTDDYLMGHYEMTSMLSRWNQLIGWNIVENGSASVLKMKNGYLTSEVEELEPAEIEEMADSVESFVDFLDNQGIDFLYVNCPTKVDEAKTELPDYAVEFSNENADALLSALSERNVDTLDLRDNIKEEGINQCDLYYITDTHWTTEAGLWASEIIAKRLNEEYGFEYDMTYFDRASYSFETYPEYFLGGEGRKITLANCSLEDFTTIFPRYDTNYHVVIPTRTFDKTGDYKDVFFAEQNFKDIANFTEADWLERLDTYHCIGVRNWANTQIENLNSTNNDGKKILLIRDSFGVHLTTYLSADIQYLDVINPIDFTGSLESYIKQTKPDMVIMIESEYHIIPIDWSNHNSIFDFR